MREQDYYLVLGALRAASVALDEAYSMTPAFKTLKESDPVAELKRLIAVAQEAILDAKCHAMKGGK